MWKTKLLKFFFKKQIDQIVKDIKLEEYINQHFHLANGLTSPELQFRGKEMIKYMAASVYELVKEADNYVEMDLISQDYEPLTITIQKKRKLSPHQRANKLQKEVELLSEKYAQVLEELNKKEKDV